MARRVPLPLGGECFVRLPTLGPGSGRVKTKDYKNRTINNHRLHPETLMTGYGYSPALSEGAFKPPIFLTSTSVFETARQGKAFFDPTAGRRNPREGERSGLVYSRFNNRISRSWRTGWRRGTNEALGRVCQRHGRNLVGHARLSASRRPDPAQPAALWPHRDADRASRVDRTSRRGEVPARRDRFDRCADQHLGRDRERRRSDRRSGAGARPGDLPAATMSAIRKEPARLETSR